MLSAPAIVLGGVGIACLGGAIGFPMVLAVSAIVLITSLAGFSIWHIITTPHHYKFNFVWLLVIAIVACLLIAIPFSVPHHNAPEQATAEALLNRIRPHLNAIIKAHYTNAACHVFHGRLLAEYQTRIFLVHEPHTDVPGCWSDPFEERGPQADGIYLEVTVRNEIKSRANSYQAWRNIRRPYYEIARRDLYLTNRQVQVHAEIRFVTPGDMSAIAAIQQVIERNFTQNK